MSDIAVPSITKPPTRYGRPSVLLTKEQLQESIVENLFLMRQIHLLVGPSTAGKSRWLFGMIDAWQRGQQIFGGASTPQPFVYVAADRDYSSVRATMFSMGFDSEEHPLDWLACPGKGWPIFSLLEDKGFFHDKELVDILKRYVLKEYPEAKVIFVEGLGMNVPGGKISDYSTVKRFLHKLLMVCQEGRTLVGTIHTPKEREGEEIVLSREKALGTIAWSGVTDTMVLFDMFKGEDDPRRKLHVSPHGVGKNRTIHLTFQDDGMLHEMEDPAVSESREDKEFSKMVLDFAGTVEKFIVAELITYFVAHEKSESSAKRALKELLAVGRIERLHRGQYKLRQAEALDLRPFEEEALPAPNFPS